MKNLNDKPLLAVISQGCAANFGEGEKIARLFEDEYQVFFGIPDKSAAEPAVFILNVCTVKGNSTALKLLREAKATAPEAKILITGCAPKDLQEDVRKMFRDVRFTSLTELGKERSSSQIPSAHSATVLRESPLVGIINIEEGCQDACAYCSTRLVKGRLKSYSAASIIEQAQQLVSDGCVELQLTGQDCGCYGFDFADTSRNINPAQNLAELVQQILVKVPGDYRIRLGMGNPRHIKNYLEPLLECFQEDRVYKFVHLPVQSGSEQILQAMNRKHTARDYIDLAAEFNKRFSLFTLSTDLIVGFPGETDQDFADTLAVLQETRPTVCNITRFVSRPGTPAAHMPNIVSDAVKHQRSAELAAAFQAIASENNARWIGQTERVTVEKTGYRKGTVIARNDAYRPVAIATSSSQETRPGTRIKVDISAAEAFALIGIPTK